MFLDFFFHFLLNEVPGPGYIFPGMISSAYSRERIIFSQSWSEAWECGLNQDMDIGIAAIWFFFCYSYYCFIFYKYEFSLQCSGFFLTLIFFFCLFVFTFNSNSDFLDTNYDLHAILAFGKLWPKDQIQWLLIF